MSFLDAIRAALPDPTEFWQSVLAAAPNVIAAIALLIVGHYVGKILAYLISRLLQRVGLDKLGDRAGLNDMAVGESFTLTPSAIFGRIVYWLVFLTFLISAADALGLDYVSATINDFVDYLPKVIGALLVLVIGLAAAQFARSLVETALAGINLGYERVVGGLVYGIIVIVVLSLAINQLEVDTALMNQVIVIVLLGAAAAIALAMGLGTRDVAGNIVAGVYARDLYEPGRKIRVGETSGEIVEVGATSLIVRTPDNTTVTIPNRRLLDEQVEIHD
ncbi:MAG: mechanosensitive ion channel domain-containing protein [Pseudomonadota bacterium]